MDSFTQHSPHSSSEFLLLQEAQAFSITDQKPVPIHTLNLKFLNGLHHHSSTVRRSLLKLEIGKRCLLICKRLHYAFQ